MTLVEQPAVGWLDIQTRFRLHGPGVGRLDRAGLADVTGLSTPDSRRSVRNGVDRNDFDPLGTASRCSADGSLVDRLAYFA